MNQTLPNSAFFLPPLSAENNGVDFLGLRQVNLDMMAELIPATNNVTAYIRPFALLSWIFWKFHDLCGRSGLSEPSSEDIRMFRERIEILFTWGARLHEVPNIPGKDAAPPADAVDDVPLTFEAWHRVQNSTSLIAALWYGPASKTVTGLGFLEPFKSGFFRVTASGSSSAQALDRVLRTEQEVYSRVIDTLRPVAATENDARALWRCWSVFSPTEVERQCFQSALFDAGSVGDYRRPIGKRSSTIALARLHLSQSGVPLDAAAIRQGMYFSMTPNGAGYSVPDKLAPARRKWIILQVRQLQRLALETLLSWCERKVIGGVTDTAALTADAEQAFRAQAIELNVDDGLASIIAGLDANISSPDQFVALGRAEQKFSPFGLMDEIGAASAQSDDRVAAHCLYALLVCASFAGSFSDTDRHLVSIGGASRLSLFHLRKRLIALGDLTLKLGIQFILEAMIISQHFATAVNRFDGQNQRLRLSIEEAGLISLVRKPWQPTVTEDRLAILLRLAADCGLIQARGDAFLS